MLNKNKIKKKKRKRRILETWREERVDTLGEPKPI
jgi:hypothetical protein